MFENSCFISSLLSVWGFFFSIFIYFYGCAWSLLLLQLLSSCDVWASHCGEFSCWGAQAPGHVGFSSCGARA